MIEIKICDVAQSTSKDDFFGGDKIVVRYKPEGSKSFQTRSVGDDYNSNKLMLERMVAELLRKAFPSEGQAKVGTAEPVEAYEPPAAVHQDQPMIGLAQTGPV